MPFRSTAQQRFAFGTGQPWAKRWAKETDFSKIPKRVRKKMKDAAATAGPLLAGPGGLLGTPGLGRRWGNRRKDKACTCGVATKEQLAPGVTRIRGNLCNVHGRYGPCDVAQSGKKKPKAGKGRKPGKPRKAVQTPEERAQARSAERDANRTQVFSQLGIPEDAAGALSDLRAGVAVDDDGGLVKLGLAEQAADGSYRLTPSGRALVAAANSGDPGRARDIMSGAKDRKAARDARETAAQLRKQQAAAKRAEAAAKRAEAAAKKPKASGGGGKKGGGSSGGGGSSSDADRAQQRQQREQERQADRAQRQREHAADRAQRQQEHQDDRAQRQRERSEDRQAALDARRARQAPTRVPASRTPIVTHGGPNTGTRRTNAPTKQRRAGGAKPTRQRQAGKSFTVYKDASGAYRWVARSTTAYRDRDREILEIAALDADSQRMTAAKQFGPLRWWHVGKPDALDAQAPWGPGLDLGDCDFSMQIGTTRVESGTFKDATLAETIGGAADQYELSPGFFHPYGQHGPPDGIYQQMRTFERSLVPTRYGRASNLFTGLTVKEFSMDPNEMERRFKAAIAELRLSPEQAETLAAGLVQADKSAADQGIAYKSDDAPEVYQLADGTQGIIQDGRFVALKAAAMDAEDDPAMGGDSGIDEEAEGEPPLDEGDGQYIGDMTPQEFWAQLQQYLAPVLKMQEMHKTIGDMVGELKGMGAAYATKDATTVARIAQLEAELKSLKGDQPALTLPSDVEAALKSQGPQPPPDPSAPQLPADATAIQRLAAQTMPALYSNAPNGQFSGWHPLQPIPPQQS